MVADIIKKESKTSGLNGKEAAVIAIKFLQELMKPDNIMLEEIELSKDGSFWIITLSYDTYSIKSIQGLTKVVKILNTPFGKLDQIKNPRSFKVFKVHRKTGKVTSMKIRD